MQTLLHRQRFPCRFLSHVGDEAFRYGGSDARARSFLAAEQRQWLPDLDQREFSGAAQRFAHLAGQPVQEVCPPYLIAISMCSHFH